MPVEYQDGSPVTFVMVDSQGRQGLSRYFLPLTVRWSRYTTIDKGPASVLAAVRRGSTEGTLLDATAEPEFISVLLAKLSAGETVSAGDQKVEFRPTTAFEGQPPEIKVIHAIDREQSNSSVVVDNKYVVKIFRKVTPGIHPEFEMGRFLADVAHFKNTPALLGTVELVEGETRTALATVHAFIQNQGDAWGVTGASLDRLIDEQRLLPDEIAAETSEMTSMLQRMRQIGRRTAELHHALASHDVDGFTPEPIAAEDSARWSEAIAARAARVFEMLQTNADRLAGPAAALAQGLLGQREAIFAHIGSLKDARFIGSKIRHHGDFHLGQILIAKDDAYILDFEGEPRQSLEQRRSKAPPARDVAGFFRSLDYAASAAIERAPNISREAKLVKLADKLVNLRDVADHPPAKWDLARRQEYFDWAKQVIADRIRLWGARLGAAFWDSYKEALTETNVWPADEDQARLLINLFQIEKAFYEIEYELTNRPAWTHIPLDGAWRILAERGVVQ